MKRILHRILSRHPSLYGRVLQLLGGGSWEKRIFLAIVREGWVVLDVGANRGYFTRLFSDIAGPGGAVHAFEPVPSTFAMLKAEMEAGGGYANFTLNNVALGDKEGAVTIHLPGNDDGQASMQPHDSGSWRGEAPVRSCECSVRTLDAYAAEMERLDFIKCDVEGAELLVVQGAGKTLERLSPMLYLEANPEWTKAFGYTPGDLIANLREHGYDTFFLSRETLVPYQGGVIFGSADLLCAKAKLHSQQLRALGHI